MITQNQQSTFWQERFVLLIFVFTGRRDLFHCFKSLLPVEQISLLPVKQICFTGLGDLLHWSESSTSARNKRFAID
jgi:hypothetical protein